MIGLLESFLDHTVGSDHHHHHHHHTPANADGGTITVSDGNSGAGISLSGGAGIGNGETLIVDGAVSADIAFTGSSGTLLLEQPSTFTGTVSGFGAQNIIDLQGIAFNSNTTLAYSQNVAETGGTLTVANGGNSANIALLGNYLAASFVAAADGPSGTQITEAAQPSNQLSLVASHP